MKSIIKSLFFTIMFSTIFYSCELDNYDFPDASISGRIIDSETNELVQSDLINGTTIKLIEHGYDPVSPQYLRVKTDGTYSNTLLFSNTYTVQPDLRNFVQVDEQEIKIGKNTTLDFVVTPYLRITNVSFEKEGNSIIANFSIKQNTPDAVRKIGLYAHSERIVGEPVRLVASEREINRQVDSDEVFKLAINVARNTTFFKPNEAYYFRIGAVTSVPGIKYNYAPAELIELGEIVEEPEPAGVFFDDAESLDGWDGPDMSLDSDNPQQGSHSVKFNAGGPFIIQKELSEPINTNVGIDYGVFQFDLYISDISVFNWDWPGQIELTSSGQPDQQELHWNFTSQIRPRNGWNRLALKLSDATVSGGNIDLSAVNFFRMYHLDVSGPVEIKIDNMKFYEEY